MIFSIQAQIAVLLTTSWVATIAVPFITKKHDALGLELYDNYFI